MKRHSVKVLVLALFFVGSLFFLFSSLKKEPQKKISGLVNRQAPQFRVLKFSKTGTEEYVELSDYKGAPLVLSFWASWCSVCHEEGIYLTVKKQALEENSSLNGARFLRVAVSDSYESAHKYWLSQSETLETGFDKSGMIAVDYGLTGVPETFFIDSEGMVVYRHAGPLSEEVFDLYFGKITEENELLASSPLSK